MTVSRCRVATDLAIDTMIGTAGTAGGEPQCRHRDCAMSSEAEPRATGANPERLDSRCAATCLNEMGLKLDDVHGERGMSNVASRDRALPEDVVKVASLARTTDHGRRQRTIQQTRQKSMTTSHLRDHGPMGSLAVEGLSAGRRVDLSSPISTFHQPVSQNQKLSNGIDDPGYRVTAEISNSMKSDRHPGSAREEDLQPASTFAMRSVWKLAPKRRAGSTHRPPPCTISPKGQYHPTRLWDGVTGCTFTITREAFPKRSVD